MVTAVIATRGTPNDYWLEGNEYWCNRLFYITYFYFIFIIFVVLSKTTDFKKRPLIYLNIKILYLLVLRCKDTFLRINIILIPSLIAAGLLKQKTNQFSFARLLQLLLRAIRGQRCDRGAAGSLLLSKMSAPWRMLLTAWRCGTSDRYENTQVIVVLAALLISLVEKTVSFIEAWLSESAIVVCWDGGCKNVAHFFHSQYKTCVQLVF